MYYVRVGGRKCHVIGKKKNNKNCMCYLVKSLYLDIQ